MKIQILGLLSLIVCLNGCASYKRNFRNKKVADISYFADQTVALMSDLNLMVQREDTLLVRRYIEMDSPEVLEVARWNASLKQDLTHMVGYSIELVTIAESESSKEDRVQRYADYVSQYRDTIEGSQKIDEVLFDSTIRKIREQETFLKAVQAAQPLFNAATIEASIKVDHLINSLRGLANELDREIEADYSDIIRYRYKLEREKFDILTAFEIIYDAYRTDEPDLLALKTSGVIWTPDIIPEGRPTREDLSMIGDHLHLRLNALHSVQQEVKPNWDDYLAIHMELDEVFDGAVLKAQKARIILLTWIRAHQKMASGTVDPAKWFDLGDLSKQLIKEAPRAIL